MTMALASLSDVENVAGAIESANRERVAGLIVMVSEVVRRYTGQDFDVVTDDVAIVHPRDGVARLPQHPVTAVASVSRYGVTLAPATYEWTTNGYISRVLWPYGYGDDDSLYGGIVDVVGLRVVQLLWDPAPLHVVYTHGYAVPPPDVALVVAERVATMIAFGAANVQAESIDGYSVRYQRPTAVGAWTPEHRSILDTYRRSTFASVRLS